MVSGWMSSSGATCCDGWLAAACSRAASGPPWDEGAVRARLTEAGYTVTDSPNPGIAGPSVVSVACLDARRGGATDTLCVVRCRDEGCADFDARTRWESYGAFARGTTLLIHQRCGGAQEKKLPFDCRPAREAIGLLPAR